MIIRKKGTLLEEQKIEYRYKSSDDNYEFILTDKDVLSDLLRKLSGETFIVVFQFDSEKYGNILIDMVKNGKINNLEVITLPEDSYKDPEKAKKVYKKLKENGINLFLCKWEIGTPRETRTAISGKRQKWYSLHGKMLVCDDFAAIFSKNFTDDEQIESYLIIRNKSIVKEFKDKYQWLRSRFIDKITIKKWLEDYPYTIDEFMKKLIKTIEEFNLPLENLIKKINSFEAHGAFFWELLITTINTSITTGKKTKKLTEIIEKIVSIILSDGRDRYLFPQYPLPKDHKRDIISDTLEISPYTILAREILYETIKRAEKFLYIVTEPFFDEDLTYFLAAKLIENPSLDVKIFCNPVRKLMDRPEKGRELALILLALGVKFCFNERFHAKLWMSDKYLAIGSANINKMNLGHAPSKSTWKADTQFIYVTDKENIIKGVKEKVLDSFFKDYYTASEELLGIRTKVDASFFENLLKSCLKISYEKNALDALINITLMSNVVSRENALRSFKYAIELMKKYGDKKLSVQHVIAGFILELLRTRKMSGKELLENLSFLDINKKELTDVLNQLENLDLVEKDYDGTWKIKVKILP